MNSLVKICLLGVGLAVVAIFLFKLPFNSILFFGFLLACPLMHLFMGHGGHSKNSKHNHH